MPPAQGGRAAAILNYKARAPRASKKSDKKDLKRTASENDIRGFFP